MREKERRGEGEGELLLQLLTQFRWYFFSLGRTLTLKAEWDERSCVGERRKKFNFCLCWLPFSAPERERIFPLNDSLERRKSMSMKFPWLWESAGGLCGFMYESICLLRAFFSLGYREGELSFLNYGFWMNNSSWHPWGASGMSRRKRKRFVHPWREFLSSRVPCTASVLIDFDRRSLNLFLCFSSLSVPLSDWFMLLAVAISLQCLFFITFFWFLFFSYREWKETFRWKFFILFYFEKLFLLFHFWFFISLRFVCCAWTRCGKEGEWVREITRSLVEKWLAWLPISKKERKVKEKKGEMEKNEGQ